MCRNSTSVSSSSSSGREVMPAWTLEVCPADKGVDLARSGEDREDRDKFDDDSLGESVWSSYWYMLFFIVVFLQSTKVSFLRVDEVEGDGMNEKKWRLREREMADEAQKVKSGG